MLVARPVMPVRRYRPKLQSTVELCCNLTNAYLIQAVRKTFQFTVRSIMTFRKAAFVMEWIRALVRSSLSPGEVYFSSLDVW